MEEFFFSNRSEEILYDLLTNYIGKQSGHNITKYPQVRSILKNSIRNVYSIKNTYPEMRDPNMSNKLRISFLQKKVLRRCLPNIIGHIKQVDSRRNENSMVPHNRNNPLGTHMSNRNFDNSVIPPSLRQPSMPIQRPKIDDPSTFNRPPVAQIKNMPQMQPKPQMQPQMQLDTQRQAIMQNLQKPVVQPQSQLHRQSPPQQIPDRVGGEKISMETRAQLDELIQQHEPQSHNLESAGQQQFSNLKETQGTITNQPVEKDEPIQDLAKRSDDLLKEREAELKAILVQNPNPNTTTNSVEDNETDDEYKNEQDTNTDTDTDIDTDADAEADAEANTNTNTNTNNNKSNIDQERLFSEFKMSFQKEMEEKFERDMRQKMSEINITMTDIRSENVQLQRERDTLQDNIKQLMNDNMTNNNVAESFKKEIDEYKTKYEELLSTTDERMGKLKEEYEISKNELIQKVQSDVKAEMQSGFDIKYTEYETELKLLKEHIEKHQEIVLSQHKMIQNGFNGGGNLNSDTNSNSNLNSFKIFSVNRSNRIRPITWEEKKDSVGVILKKNYKIKNPIMKVDNYSIVFPSEGFPSSEIYNMKLMKILINKCNIIGEVPDFIECHIRLNKRSGENSSIINYCYNLKLDESSFNRHSSNQIGYKYHNEEKQTNDVFTMQDISVDGNIIMNVNLKSAMYPYNFIRNINRCYDVSGMSLSTASGNNVIYSLKLNVKDISDISKLRGLKQIAIEHVYFSKYVATDLNLYTHEQITSFEKWLMSGDMDIYNITHAFNGDEYEISIQIMVSLNQFNFLKKPPHSTAKWVLRNKMDTMQFGSYGVVYFPELENKLYMEIEY